MLPFGSVMRFKYVQNTYDIDTTIQGENVTWNFSNLINSSNPEYSITVVEPSKTPKGASFTDANYAWAESTPTAYRYFNLSSAKMQRVGSYSSSVNTYNDPQIEYVFPLTYGTTSYDTWDNTNSSWGGTYDFKCIGYGKLTTPGGTFNNVLLVRAMVSEGELYTIPAYFWYDADNGAPLLTYSPGDGFFIGAYATYMTVLNTSVNEAKSTSIVRYNNPVNNMLNLVLDNNQNELCNYVVYNTLGQAMQSGTEASSAMRIDVSALPAGTYFLSLNTKNSTEAVKRIKFVKQ
jgi:hypothetical protein